MIFFGQRSEVLGFPNNLQDTADAFKKYGYNFGSIETYDPKQIQKGNDGLAKLIIGRTTRVEAIAKTEQDQLDFEPIVARYLLGVRERNMRVVYLRPFTKAIPGQTFTPEGANVQLVSRIADGIRARGYKLGPATPIEDFKTPLVAVLLVALAVPAFFVLLLDELGVEAPLWALSAYVATVLVIIAGYALHHDLLGRKIVALAGAILFATGAVVAIRRSFTSPVPATLGASIASGFRTAGTALGVSLGGAAIVVGLCSSALLMEEIDRFSGVKAVIVVPPILAAMIVLFSKRFGGSIAGGTGALKSPVRAYQLGLVAVLAAGALLYVMRSGNQSDIAPSTFELALRSHLTAFLGVRPRFKEFVIGFPLMMLLPTLSLEIRRRFGWLLAARDRGRHRRHRRHVLASAHAADRVALARLQRRRPRLSDRPAGDRDLSCRRRAPIADGRIAGTDRDDRIERSRHANRGQAQHRYPESGGIISAQRREQRGALAVRYGGGNFKGCDPVEMGLHRPPCRG